MKRRVMTRLILVASLAYVGLTVLLPGTMPTAETDRNDPGFGSVDTLMASYNEWEATYVANGGDRRLTISLGSAKGLATTSSTTHGRMILDLLAGTISVEVAALPEGTWEVWLIENRPGPGRSVLPEPGDQDGASWESGPAGRVGDTRCQPRPRGFRTVRSGSCDGDSRGLRSCERPAARRHHHAVPPTLSQWTARAVREVEQC